MKGRFSPIWLGLLILPIIYLLFRPQSSKNIVRINQLDPALQQAIKTAQSRLPEFIAALKSPGKNRFAVKAKFMTPVGDEYLWVKDVTYADGFFEGTIDQKPIAVEGKSKGDPAKVEQSDVVDWMILSDKGIEGEFTEEALRIHH